MFRSIQVANFFITRAVSVKKPITPMKLQKLVYFAHGWYLALKQEPLIDESVEAWKYGPVVPSLYHLFKTYGNSDILKPHAAFSTLPSITDAITLEVLELVWELYSDLSPIQLSNLTHQVDSPWQVTLKEYLDKGRELPKGKDISDSVIAEYFTKMLKDSGS